MAKPGIAKKRVAQRRLHAVVAKPKQSQQSKVAGWLARMIALVMRKALGRG
jgi:hypothetical protein